MDKGQHASVGWRYAVRKIAAGPLLGLACVAVVLLGVGAWGVAVGHVGYFMMFPAPVLAGAALNLSSWLAAIVFGQTRQLRASWFSFVAVLGALTIAMSVWPTWGRDLEIPIGIAVFALGLPSDLILLPLMAKPFPWGTSANVVLVPLLFLGVAYLQAFVFLPRLFGWRARASSEASRER
jgi:hypothetical protein